ncbi:MAG: gfo/Idh/MocA family oxidoreductase [Chloroflexi bacterium]|nr:gfo/Idh/MocA family oxidoreductase [Chloroflexota bacterium]
MANEPHPLRFGIAGVAAAAGEARSITAHPSCTITAVADRSQANIDAFTAQYPCDIYTEVERMCAAPNVDAVFIGTPTQFHVEHAMLAIEHGKHVILAKPMATNLDDAQLLVEAAERRGVWLSIGHTQGFEPPIFKIREIIESGELGPLRLINTWNYTDWIYRGRVPEELDSSQGGGVVFRQGAHQMDIVRWIGGGLVRTVRAMTGVWDPERPAEGVYAAFLEFADGAVASCTLSGYDYFHSAELGFGIGEGGQRVRNAEPGSARAALRRARASRGGEAAYKVARRSGHGRDPVVSHETAAPVGPSDHPRGERSHSFYGLTVVTCERGDIRQSPNGLLIYDDGGRREVEIPRTLDGRDVMIQQFSDAVVGDRPPPHDGRWGLATLEAQLAILASGRSRGAIELVHQVPARGVQGSSSLLSGAHQ